MNRALRWCLLVSLVLHLLAALVADNVVVRQDHEAFRARLAVAPRFTPPPRRLTAPPTLPTVTMDYRAPAREAAADGAASPAAPGAHQQAAQCPGADGGVVPAQVLTQAGIIGAALAAGVDRS